MDGWIKLHRQLLESQIFHNEKLLKVFIYCLLKASHKEHEQQVGLTKVILQPGQFIFGRLKASEELNLKGSTVWMYMKLLDEEHHCISICSNNKYSIVTVVNWGLYQTDGKITDNKITTNWQQTDTNKNDNNNLYSYISNKESLEDTSSPGYKKLAALAEEIFG